MAKRTPVQIGSTHYPSTNQARLVYSAILNKYPEGRRLDKPDTELVKSLMSSSEFATLSMIHTSASRRVLLANIALPASGVTSSSVACPS